MSNLDTVRSAYEAFGHGDLQALKEMMTEDGTWLTSDELPLGGETHGRDEIIGNFAQIPNYWSSFSVEPEEFIDGGDWVVVRGTQRAGHNGELRGALRSPAQVRRGKIARGEFYADSAKAAKVLA